MKKIFKVLAIGFMLVSLVACATTKPAGWLEGLTEESGANVIRGFTCLTGGTTGCLDKISVAVLTDGDIGFVATTDYFYVFKFDDDAEDAESSPIYVRPDDATYAPTGDPTNGVWKLIGYYGKVLVGAPSAAPTASFRDSDAEVKTRDHVTIGANLTTTTDGSEDADFELKAMIAGTLTKFLGFDASAKSVETTQLLTGRIPVVAGGGKTLSGLDLYGSIQLATEAGTWVIPDVDATTGVGLSFCIYVTGAYEVLIDCDAEDKIRLGGTLGAAGGDIHNDTAEAAGDYVCLVLTDFATNVAHWTVLGYKGTWTVP
jgi:hypothetical protein